MYLSDPVEERLEFFQALNWLLCHHPNIPLHVRMSELETLYEIQGSTIKNQYQKTSELFNVNVIVYELDYTNKKFQCFKKKVQIENQKEATFYFLEYTKRYGAFLKKSEHLLTRKFRCSKCCQWKNFISKHLFMTDHYKKCNFCYLCKKHYMLKDDIAHTCKQKNSNDIEPKKRKEKKTCRKYEKEKIPSYLLDNHHADFEAHPENGFFIPDAVCIHVAGTDIYNDLKIFSGPSTLDDFMSFLIQEMKGTLWFFCGGRFDVYFILKWLMEKNIILIHDECLIKESNITALSFYTKKGQLTIKDIGKFFTGSLDFNCKGFGLDKEDSKSFFDHGKVNNWEDFYEHYDERMLYLKQDVISQKKLYDLLAEDIWNDYHLNIDNFVSLSQLAYACFSSTLKGFEMVKTSNEDEEAFREAYRGGRMVLTRPFWFSSDYEEIIQNFNNYDFLKTKFNDIDDYLLYLDKNSLYPSVMASETKKIKYPCGAYEKIIVNQENHSSLLQHINNKDKLPLAIEFWDSKIVQVDVNCPKNIYVGFLMSRNKEGRNIQDLNPKKNAWYTGSEIIEAILVGYVVTKIHAYYQFKYYKEIFNEFIMRNWKKKAEAVRDTAPYMTSKMNMNALSGKFGQKKQPKKIRILTGSDIKAYYLSKDDTQILWNREEDEIVGLIVKEKNEVKYSSYPIQLSTVTLGKSKVSMSSFMREANAYHDPEMVPYYGDTDSLIMHRKVKEVADKKEFGKELGQMKDEYPDSRIFAIIVLAPKMYMKLFLEFSKKRQRYEILCNFTSKGIPHMKQSYEAFKDYRVPPLVAEHAIQIFHFIERRKDFNHHEKQRWNGPVYLKSPYYITIFNGKNGKEYEVKDRVTWNDLIYVMKREAEIHLIYGTMTRSLKTEVDYENVGITIDYNKREISSELWWDKGSRLFDPSVTEKNILSIPLGHEDEKKCKDLSYIEIKI